MFEYGFDGARIDPAASTLLAVKGTELDVLGSPSFVFCTLVASASYVSDQRNATSRWTPR